MCEECDTWQHILCYYPNELVPAVHFCEDCGSKYHDTKRAEKCRKIVPEAVSPNPNPSDSTDRSVAGAICTGRDGAIPHIVAAIGEREASSDKRA